MTGYLVLRCEEASFALIALVPRTMPTALLAHRRKPRADQCVPTY